MLRMMLGVLLVALSSAGGAQAPSFDVASVKPNKSGETRVRFALPPGRFTASNASLASTRCSRRPTGTSGRRSTTRSASSRASPSA